LMTFRCGKTKSVNWTRKWQKTLEIYIIILDENPVIINFKGHFVTGL
jgi:hypothetical protein